MAERKHGAPAPKTEATRAGEDWSEYDISGQRYTRVLFVDLDLTEVVNDGAMFEECTFRRARFNASRHTDAAFVNCTFASCDFFDARFIECKFVGSMFSRCTHDVMQVIGGNWSFVGLTGADLRSATFTGVRMRESDLTGARCEGGSLRNVDLAGASLHYANLAGCDLRGSDLASADPSAADLKGAIITPRQAVDIAQALGLDVRPE